MGVPFASLENVVQAIREAGLEAFINSLPNRLQTHIGERGMNISGGQRQRLAIARALLRNPQILILDEATSNLDSQTEQAIQNTIEQLKQHKTIIIIAHRLSTIICADQIVVMEQGRILQQGTHEQLIQDQGKYKDLWQAQMAHSKTKLNGFYPAVVSTQEIK